MRRKLSINASVTTGEVGGLIVDSIEVMLGWAVVLGKVGVVEREVLKGMAVVGVTIRRNVRMEIRSIIVGE